jgi:hypothetical protein
LKTSCFLKKVILLADHAILCAIFKFLKRVIESLMLREKLKELVRDERKSNAEVIRSLREVQLKGLHLE